MAPPRPAATGLRALPRNVWVVTLTSFLTDVSSEMLTTLLPLYLKDVLGARMVAIGLVEGVAETTASLLKVGSGWVSDRSGRRKGLAVSGYALSSVAKPFLLLANSWAWVLCIRFAERVGKGVRSAPRDALVADSTEAGQRGLAFGIHRAGDTAGAVVGLLVALAVAWSMERGALVLSPFVFQTLVVLGILPAALAVIVLAVGAREPRAAHPARPSPKGTSLPFDRRFKAFLLISIVFNLGNSSDAFLVLRAQSAGLSVVGILAMMISFNLVYALASGPAGALSDRIGRKRVIVAGWLIYALIYAGFGSVESGAGIWGLMALYGLYHAATEGVAKAYVADLVPPEARGTAYGLYHAAIGFSALPASLIAGILWQGLGPWAGLGPSAPFYFGSVSALAASIALGLGLSTTGGSRVSGT
ncbi:MAG: MFS transporter [Isosphaeraceae bacterium]